MDLRLNNVDVCLDILRTPAVFCLTVVTPEIFATLHMPPLIVSTRAVLPFFCSLNGARYRRAKAYGSISFLGKVTSGSYIRIYSAELLRYFIWKNRNNL